MDNLKEWTDFIDKSNHTLINYIDQEGYPISKMLLSPRSHQGLKTFLFSTNTSSNKVKAYRQNPKGSLYFFDRNNFLGLSLVGHFEVLNDLKTKKSLWRLGDETYYPKGVTDEDYCILKFVAIKGRYFRNLSSEDFEL